MRDWLPEGHLAWTVLDAVDVLDLSALTGSYRLGGRGRRAYDPAMMLALLIYAYAVGESSSRRIEARCEHDVAFRVIAAGDAPDHSSIAGFRARHRDTFADLFVQVLRLCREAGLVKVGTIALDGTKMAANASSQANRSAAGIQAALDAGTRAGADGDAAVVAEQLRRAEATDAAEDAEFGSDRGDEPPPGMRDRSGRLSRFAEAATRIAAREAAEAAARDAAQARYEQKVAAREAYRAEHGRNPRGRPPKPPAAPDPGRKPCRANTTDPDSVVMPTRQGFIQGYNTQVVASEDQVILDSAVVTDTNDTAQLAPMTRAALIMLRLLGLEVPHTVLADAGYWNTTAITDLDTAHDHGLGPEPVVPPDRAALRPEPGEHDPKRQSTRARRMRERLREPERRTHYQRRSAIIEPVFGQIKQRTGDRFRLRGLTAVNAEFKLIAMTHNLLKLHVATG